MGVVDGFKGAGLFTKIAFILLLVATLFAWVAFACTGWGEDKLSGQHIGLWRICSDNDRTPGCSQTDGWANDWFAATQALVSIGFLGINVATFLLILYMFVSSCQKNGEVAMATGIVCIVTGIAYLIGVIVFAAKFKDKFIDDGLPTTDFELSYSFGLSIVALVLEILAGVFVILDSKKGGTSPSS